MSLYPAEGDITPALVDHLGDEDLPQILVGDGVPPAVAPSPFAPADPPLVLETADDIFGIAHHLERPFVGGNRFDRRCQLHALVRRLRVGTERVALWARRPSPAARAGIPDACAVGVDDDELTFSHPPSLPDHYLVSSRPPIRSMSRADGPDCQRPRSLSDGRLTRWSSKVSRTKFPTSTRSRLPSGSNPSTRSSNDKERRGPASSS